MTKREEILDPMRVPLESLIEEKHSDVGRWVVIRELRAGVGYSQIGVDQRIDVAVFDCWPSKGLNRIAYEMKRSRGDFMREIDNPKKREWVETNFHQTYFVVSHGVCKSEEVPESWGLYVATKAGDKLRRAKVAKHREIQPLPELIALSAMRALMDQKKLISNRHYFYEGMWIRQTQLDEMVGEAVKEEVGPARLSMNKLTEKAAAERKKYRSKQLELEGPLKRLASEVNEHARFSPYYERRAPITVEEVDKWIKRVHSNALRPLLSSLHYCFDSIKGALDKAQEIENEREQLLDRRSL